MQQLHFHALLIPAYQSLQRQPLEVLGQRVAIRIKCNGYCSMTQPFLHYLRDPAESQGVMGDPTVATKETGEKIIVAVVNDLAQLIVEEVQSGQA